MKERPTDADREGFVALTNEWRDGRASLTANADAALLLDERPSAMIPVILDGIERLAELGAVIDYEELIQ